MNNAPGEQLLTPRYEAFLPSFIKVMHAFLRFRPGYSPQSLQCVNL